MSIPAAPAHLSRSTAVAGRRHAVPDPGGHPLRPARSGIRVRVLLALSALLAFAVIALSDGGQPIVARPPSMRLDIPAEAFRPVAVAAERSASEWVTPGVQSSSRPLRTRRIPRVVATPERALPPAGPEHVVRSGDSLWQIAVWHRADLQLILRWNTGVDPRRLIAGQRILVPGGRPMPVPTRATTSGSRTIRLSTVGAGHLWPLTIRGTITTRFSSAHRGIDIAAPSGTPVRAIAGGTVIWAGWSTTGGGYVVEIRHPDGMRSRYLHNRRVLVKVGQVVAQGEQIAAVGSTGWSTGPHLDLRVQMGGRYIDPLRLAWSR